jgi:hypothetical protein
MTDSIAGYGRNYSSKDEKEVAELMDAIGAIASERNYDASTMVGACTSMIGQCLGEIDSSATRHRIIKFVEEGMRDVARRHASRRGAVKP